MCSTAFLTLGRAQAKALGNPSLPIAVIPHPFGLRKRDEVREIVWLASTVGALSVAGVGLAVLLAGG